jgi:hypothetical protein
MLIPQWDGRAELIIVDLGRVLGLAASIPALLLFQEFYGQGWRLSSKCCCGSMRSSYSACFS